jgi:hypothetical protein
MTYTNHDLVEEYELANGQRGIRARTHIPAGEIIGIYGGMIVQYKLDGGKITDPDARRLAVQLVVRGDTVYALVNPPSVPLSGIDFINHSCQPNVDVQGQIVLIAARDIRAGEPLTADYQDWDLVPYGERCWCPVPKCVI